ncbi:hypothetical protein FQN50_004955 [Emmonsiellopsis sp. PD_5]|nr:hypothetical protein FQN50_004955 [Emmonsiellopsis sp. PD_5]
MTEAVRVRGRTGEAVREGQLKRPVKDPEPRRLKMQYLTFMKFTGKYHDEDGLTLDSQDPEMANQLLTRPPMVLQLHNNETKTIYLVAFWPSFEDAKDFTDWLKKEDPSRVKEKLKILDYFTIPQACMNSKPKFTYHGCFHLQQFRCQPEIVTEEDKKKIADSITTYPLCQGAKYDYERQAEWAVLEMENETKGPRLIIVGLDEEGRVPIGGCWRNKIEGCDKYDCLQPEHCTGESYTPRKIINDE